VSRPRGALAEATIALGLVVIASTAAGAPPKAPPRPGGPAKASPSAPSTPLAPLPMLPSIPRVKIDVLKGQLVVIEEVNLPRGEWKGDALDFYVAFGAPGAPRAIDARLVPVGDGALEPEDDEAGEPLVVDRAPRRPASAHPLIGRDTMAGVVVHVKREALTRALEPGNMASLRVRTALDLPEEDSLGARGVVVRLGSSRGTPLTLGRLVLTAKAGAANPSRAEAHLCGPDADPTPLAIAVVPKPPPPSSPAAPATPPTPPIAPVLSIRHPTDDLCIRFWTPP
jgi:hypothetical protein